MKIGIMQPYFFPYIGYFQLIHCTDRFVIFDDVTFKKGGWINRNKILLNDKIFLFTVPLKNAGSHRLLTELYVEKRLYENWRKKFLKTLEYTYKRAPFFYEVMHVIQEVLRSEFETIADLSASSVYKMCDYLQMHTNFVTSSAKGNNRHLAGQNRIIDICRQENANTYINPSGGISLYSETDFAAQGIELRFVTPDPIIYDRGNKYFTPGLSIIDIAMFNSASTIGDFLNRYHVF